MAKQRSVKKCGWCKHTGAFGYCVGCIIGWDTVGKIIGKNRQKKLG